MGFKLFLPKNQNKKTYALEITIMVILLNLEKSGNSNPLMHNISARSDIL